MGVMSQALDLKWSRQVLARKGGFLLRNQTSDADLWRYKKREEEVEEVGNPARGGKLHDY